jgi:hypothetical protein
MDVGQDAKVLLDTAAEMRAGSSQLQGLVEFFPGGVHRAALEIEPRERVQGLCRQDGIADVHGDVMTALTQLASQFRLAALMLHDSRPAQRFSHHATFAGSLGGLDGSRIALQRLRQASALLVGSPFT